MYKFISVEEYEGSYRESHPNARVSPDGKEVVISCNFHSDGSCSCLSRDEAAKHIKLNWIDHTVENLPA